jgi:phycocyanin beta chain
METMVLDAFAKVVSQADTRGEYLSENQVNALIAFVKDGNKRVDVVNRLSSNSSAIVTDAARSLFSEQPVLVAPGGNAYTNRRAAACLRDLEIILRYVTYATFTGDPSVLEDRALNGLRETYVALGVPGASVAAGILKLKDASLALAADPNGITSGDCSSLLAEVASYFERAAAVS